MRSSRITDLLSLATWLDGGIVRPRLWTLRRARQYFERIYVDLVMRRHGDDREKVCAVLDISMSSLKEKLRSGYGGRK